MQLRDEKTIVDTTSSEPTLSGGLLQLKVNQDLTPQEYWEQVIDELEVAIRCETQPPIPQIDYTTASPSDIKAQIKRILLNDFFEDDKLFLARDDLSDDKSNCDPHPHESTQGGEPKAIEMRNHIVAESFVAEESSDNKHEDQELVRFKLKLDEPPGSRSAQEAQRNWMAKFFGQSRTERVVWESKIHAKNYELAQKSLDEQAEDLMDKSAKLFIEWLNNVGSAQDSGISVTKLKDLFSIKGDRTLLASIKTDPKEVNAIAKSVADRFNKPELAIELKYESHIKKRMAKRVEKLKAFSVFGRTVPAKCRPWIKTTIDMPIENVFPDELLTRERIFKGIRHLRSTRTLIEFFRPNPRLPKPEYLISMGDFDFVLDNRERQEVSLYESLGLKY